jgi:hypothetical protein
MSAEQVYERIVARVESEHAEPMRSEARKGIAQAAHEGNSDRDYRRDCAVDAVEKYAFDHPDFELVKATDISDIACEIADEVEQDNWLSQ